MSDSKVIYKYELPIDDEWHKLPMGKVVHIGRALGDMVHVWIQQYPLEQDWFKYRVVRTGQAVSKWHFYIGTTINEPYVWHVYQQGLPAYNAATGERASA